MLKKLLIVLVLFFSLAGQVRAADYYLPYPGLLPDHPFYWVKMARDRIQLWLTTDKAAKAEKLLSYADKRLGAGWALIDGNKKTLGVTTLSKAEKYLDEAVALGKDTTLRENLKKAIRKHEEVIVLLKEKAGDEFGGILSERLSRLNLYKEELGIQDATVEIKINVGQEKTAFEALQKVVKDNNWPLITKQYDFGVLVEGINGKINTKDKAWIFLVNQEAGKMAADKQKVNPGDVVEWKYEKPIY